MVCVNELGISHEVMSRWSHQLIITDIFNTTVKGLQFFIYFFLLLGSRTQERHLSTIFPRFGMLQCFSANSCILNRRLTFVVKEVTPDSMQKELLFRNVTHNIL